ncbi:MAG: tetratricopeptide repeat protein [Acidobacteriaceae bacterium]|nr:tetratricopeptide repeat protein [Acidobacteriaceae bacterium]
MNSAERRWAVLAAIGSLACLLNSSCGRAKAAVTQQSGYVDAIVCNGCHADIARTYRLTGMGRSAYPPTDVNVVEDYTSNDALYHAPSDRYYTLIHRSGEFYQRRHQIGFNNKETNTLERRVDVVIGSGNHARTYLHRAREGKLTELPVSWYAESGGYWAMSPGFDRPDQEDFRRVIPSDCLFCHSAYPTTAPKSVDARRTANFEKDLPKAIDCQRCHGPGLAHVAAAGSGHSTPDQIRQAIVNPRRLSRDRQLEVCMQCHLETTSLPLPNSIRNYDRDVFSYIPGQPLGDYMTYFDHADTTGVQGSDRFEIAHAAYRLRKSACFRQTQMTCITCHSPHEAFRGEAATEHYTAACRSCHAQAHASQTLNATCMDCHMPKRRAEDAVHVVMTDHYIRREPPVHRVIDKLTEQGTYVLYKGPVSVYYPSPPGRTPRTELYSAVAQVKDGANLNTGIPLLASVIAQYRPPEPEFYFELGEAHAKTGNEAEAIRDYEQALRKQPNFVPARKQLVAALLRNRQDVRAIKLLEPLQASYAADAADLTNLGNAYLRNGKPVFAERALKQSLELNPDLPETHNLLGVLELQRDKVEPAEEHFRQAIALEPEMAEAHVNLADLLTGKHSFEEAGYEYQKAIAYDPSSATAHHHYGLLLELVNAYDKAAIEFRAALKIDGKLARAHVDLADLLGAQRNYGEAAVEYRLATTAKPDLADAYIGLGKVLGAAGDLAGEEQALRLAIQRNPELYEAHLLIARINMRAGNLVEARAHYQKAAQSPDPEVRDAARKEMR